MKNTREVLHIIDSHEYVMTNCFQHQLFRALQSLDNTSIRTVSIDQLPSLNKATGAFDSVLSCLKQRTLYRYASGLKNYLGNVPITIYDQDPWEAFRDNSPYQGAYNLIAENLNVKTFAVTTKWWSDYTVSQKLPSIFVKMSVLPEYCDAGKFDDRSIELGFLGRLHPHRQKLFDQLQKLGLNPTVKQSSVQYKDYMSALSDIKIFIHSEDSEVLVNGQRFNLNVGLWVKDIEAASRGCFSIRNKAEGHETYLTGLKTVLLYDDPNEIPSIVDGIRKMDPAKRQSLINESVEFIRQSNVWQETANLLIG